MAKDQNEPRISLNKLCEFMTATVSRQRTIIRDQKFPQDYMVMYHKEAQEAVSQYLASNLEDVSYITKQLDILNQMSPETIGTQRRINSNIEALENFLEMLDQIDFKGAVPELGEQFPPKLPCRNVQISVRPEIILRAKGKAGPLIGALKIHFPKTNPLNDGAAGYVSAILQEWCAAHKADEGTAHGPLCYVMDVGSKAVYPGVKATAKRMNDINDACDTIAALWPTITK